MESNLLAHIGLNNFSRAMSSDGSAGAIREAGGSFGKKEAADEERYFRKLVSHPAVKGLKNNLLTTSVQSICY